MNNKLDIYLSTIQKMKEDDFSKKVLKPLFESMGFYRVDFVGGPYEQGKDLIALYKVPLKGDSIYVIQTKKIGEKANTSEKAILSDLITQLRQCITKKIKLHNGEEKKPDYVYLATPYQISNRLLNEIHEQLIIENKSIEILDGPKTINLIKEYNPEILTSILSIESKILIQDISQLQNLELISALNQKDLFNNVNCYNDLAFFMGSIDSNILLDSDISFSNEQKILTVNQWEFLKREVIQPLEEILCFSPLTKDIKDTESEYKKILNKHKSKENREIKDDINDINNKILSLKEGIYRVIEEASHIALQANKNKDLGDLMRKLSTDTYFIFKNEKDAGFSLESLNKLKKHIELNEIEILAKKFSHSAFPKFISYTNILSDLLQTENELSNLQTKYISEPYISFSISSIKINSWVKSKTTSYKKSIKEINSGNEKTNIMLFLKDTQDVLNLLDIFLNKDNTIKELINITKSNNTKRDGISISPFNIFDTRNDIAVYGGAGAGKTTTLQTYTKLLIERNPKSVVYLALNRLINKVNISLEEKKESSELILELILISRGIVNNNENREDLKRHFSQEEGLKIILDGLDEAYSKFSGIILAINDFKNRFKKIQIIISSRDCVSYLSQINFLGITLLPFNEVQLFKFIRGWFIDKHKNLAEPLISRLTGSSFFEVVKTPLLATLLCDLTEKGIEIPSTESEIFSKRLELLCGMYDNYKDIKRTKLPQSILRKSAIKIGYAFHERNLRSAPKEKIIKYLQLDRTFNLDDVSCELAVKELINPCNILVFDSLSETYSLGHLRYQEHLASQELIENRSIDILPLLKNDWWRGTLCLYAQACQFTNFIDEFTIKYGNIHPALITLREMCKHRPLTERNSINFLLQQYEKTDDFFIGDNEFLF